MGASPRARARGSAGVAAGAVGGARRLAGVRVVALGSAAAISAAALLAASGWLVTRAAEQPPVLALLAAIVVVRAVGLVRAFARYGERIAGHDVAFRKLATVRVRWYRRLIAGATELPAADLLSRFVIDVDELQHRDLRVRWPAAVAAIAALATAALATAIHPTAGLVLATGLAIAATSSPHSRTEPRVASCAAKARRGRSSSTNWSRPWTAPPNSRWPAAHRNASIGSTRPQTTSRPSPGATPRPPRSPRVSARSSPARP